MYKLVEDLISDLEYFNRFQISCYDKITKKVSTAKNALRLKHPFCERAIDQIRYNLGVKLKLSKLHVQYCAPQIQVRMIRDIEKL